MSVLRHTRHDQEDQAMQWLAQQAPQFHSHTKYASSTRDDDDASSAYPSDVGSDTSDSEDEDPSHPYNRQDNGKWIHQGGFVYPPDIDTSFLNNGPTEVVADDMPFVPPSLDEEKFHNPYLHPRDLPISGNLFPNERLFRSDPPFNPRASSPLHLSPRMPSLPPPATASRAGSSRRAPPRRPQTYKEPEEDEDEDAYTSGDDASEDEYVPSPKVRSRKLPSSRTSPSSRTKARARSSAARLSYSPYSSSSPSTPSSAAESPAGGVRRPGSRNVQIFDQPPPPRGSWSKTGPDAYKCPYCTHEQLNRRSPDMERHIRSHFRSAGCAQWVCAGVPVEEAAQYGVRTDDNPREFQGRLMVGGCQEDFSRMDALKRHWKNANNTCVGDIAYARAH